MASLSTVLGPILRRTWHVLLGARPLPVGAASAVYVGDHTLLVRTVYQDWIYLDSRDTSLTPILSLVGDWEPFISRLFSKTVRPGMTVVDIGCKLRLLRPDRGAACR